MPLARGDIEHVERLATGRIRHHADRLDGVGHLGQEQRHVVHAAQIEAVSRVDSFEAGRITTEEVALVGGRSQRVDHDIGKFRVIRQRQDDIGRVVVAAGAGQLGKAALINQSAVVTISKQRAGGLDQVVLGALLAHLAASIHAVTGLVDFEREVSKGQGLQAAIQLLIAHARATGELMEQLHIHGIAALLGQVGDANYRRTCTGLLAAVDLDALGGLIGQHVHQRVGTVGRRKQCGLQNLVGLRRGDLGHGPLLHENKNPDTVVGVGLLKWGVG